MLLVFISLCTLACQGKRPDQQAPAADAMTREQFVQVEIDSECARLAANAEIDRVDEFREAALVKIGKTRLDRTLALGRYLDDARVAEEVASATAECRRKAGWREQPGLDGVKTWVRSEN